MHFARLIVCILTAWLKTSQGSKVSGCESRNKHRFVVVVQDSATQWIQAYPCKTKTSQETQRSLQKFLEPTRKPKVIYTDNSLEFDKALESLFVNTTQIGNTWDCCKSSAQEWRKVRLLYCCNQVWMKVGGQIPWNVTPIWETWQIYYLMGRRPMKDVLGNHLKYQSFHLVHWLSITLLQYLEWRDICGAIALQSSLGNEWCADSVECYCYLRNIQDLLSDGKTPYERRFGMPFNGPVIPFGAMVEYHPISAKDTSRLHQFRRHYGRRHWRFGGDGRISEIFSKTDSMQRKC